MSPHLKACVASFVRNGHPFTLYSYGNVEVPKGVTLADGGVILDPVLAAEFVRAGKYSLLSNYFRYELLARRPGVCWVDVDMYCLKPVEAAPYIFGWEDNECINGAILAIPAESPVLTALRGMFQKPNFIPPWLSLSRRLGYCFGELRGKPAGPMAYPWGTFGPKALTWYVGKHQLMGQAHPPPYFYPVHYRNLDTFFEPDADWQGPELKRAWTVHLWNEFLRKRSDLNSPPRGSFLWKLYNEVPVAAG